MTGGEFRPLRAPDFVGNETAVQKEDRGTLTLDLVPRLDTRKCDVFTHVFSSVNRGTDFAYDSVPCTAPRTGFVCITSDVMLTLQHNIPGNGLCRTDLRTHSSSRGTILTHSVVVDPQQRQEQIQFKFLPTTPENAFQAVGWIKGRARRALSLRVHSQRLSAWNMAHTNTSAHEIDRTVNITKSSTVEIPLLPSAPLPRKRCRTDR
jgi:hypothetical protein